MIHTSRTQLLLATIVAVAIGAAGCSSDSSSPEPLRILVTNDDGVGAPGIDALVEALLENPDNVVVVSAPAENQSGKGDQTTPPPLQASQTTTASGYPATAVDGFPADSVIYGLENLYTDEPLPHVVLSGINEGQNVGNVAGALSQLSGTVGAAKTAACLGIPALASSQGDPEDKQDEENWNYPSGVDEVLTWLEANRGALLAGTVSLENITSINIPTCNAGEIRGRAEVPLATQIPDYIKGLLDPQDCESTREDPQDDAEAFFNGFVSITPVPSNSSGTCDSLSN